MSNNKIEKLNQVIKHKRLIIDTPVKVLHASGQKISSKILLSIISKLTSDLSTNEIVKVMMMF